LEQFQEKLPQVRRRSSCTHPTQKQEEETFSYLDETVNDDKFLIFNLLFTFSVFSLAGWASIGTIGIALFLHLFPSVWRLESRLTGIASTYTSSYTAANTQVVKFVEIVVFTAAGTSATARNGTGRRRGLNH
jgi:hypothetical protein